MKKLSFVIVLAFALVLLFGGAAYANFGPHGGFATDTDSCAGCHRAHTSFSSCHVDRPGQQRAQRVADLVGDDGCRVLLCVPRRRRAGCGDQRRVRRLRFRPDVGMTLRRFARVLVELAVRRPAQRRRFR